MLVCRPSPQYSQKGGLMMAGKTDYKNKWQQENKERINLVVAKGSKDIIKDHAEARGESVNGFINRAIAETMERDKSATE